MKVVITYAKRDTTDREVIRKKIIVLPGPAVKSVNWDAALNAAFHNKEPGERIVQISEAGYHLC